MKQGLANKEEYIRARGQVCPRCRSDQLVFLDSDNDRGAVVEKVNCAVCDLTFERVFRLQGYMVVDAVTD